MLFAVSVFTVWDKVQSWTNFSCHQIGYHIKENDLWLGLLTRNTFYLGGAYFKYSRTQWRGGGVKKGSKSAVIIYCLNAVGRGKGDKKDPKVAVILKVSPPNAKVNTI